MTKISINTPKDSPYLQPYFERSEMHVKPITVKQNYKKANSIEIAFFGDLHIGSSGCDWQMMCEHVKYFVDNGIYVIGEKPNLTEDTDEENEDGDDFY